MRTGGIDTSAQEKRLLNAQRRYKLPDGARQIILVRHGSTGGEHVARLPFGDIELTNPALLPEGHIQAEAVAQRLKHEKFNRIFVTPLQRTHQTAAPLAALTGIEPMVIPELREAFLGDYEHEFYVRAAAGDPLLKRMFAEASWDMIPNAEPMVDFAARLTRGIEKIAELLEPDTTGIAFSHGGAISEICRQATGARRFGFQAPENTSISRIVILPDGRWNLRGFNDVSHVPPGE